MPVRVFICGNHEQRIFTALDHQPELGGAISFDDLRLNDWYDEVVMYEGVTPGVREIDGVAYSHYFTSGIMGRPISSENMGQALVNKLYASGTMGHTHLFDLAVRTRADGNKILGAVCGCYQDFTNDWAGEIGKVWDRGVLIKRQVVKGQYDFEWINIKTIKNEYGY